MCLFVAKESKVYEILHPVNEPFEIDSFYYEFLRCGTLKLDGATKGWQVLRAREYRAQ